ncbi:5-formyltetrahydrofolate cyclo-ligase [Mycolicibacterium sp. 120270]|uniref:5-formyltetrahydrofolate cyclo-ligase n=1 Tax=Mycolicibacterium sp. 120270 TaxID=3090600 RepID=UPI00299DC22F|nr:5-formyltetrahydrofolate cyclo-ligase [Mycolicibacterium sp. 120270]MDX1885072.1 5-formyltetrahydrofolate cyclo-ligase [Mycolicibacterium sp. 120270]
MTSGSKTEARKAILAARREVTAAVHDAEADALCGHLPGLVGAAQTVCAYVPIKFEPGSITLLDKLLQLGKRVLLPVARSDDGAPHPMRWGVYRTGGLVPARLGLQEPQQPWLPAEAVAEAAVVLVPTLAVDRTGTRLGRGAGFYDRTLPLAAPTARLVAVVRDDELVDELPAEPHDVRMTHALTPNRGLVELG